MAPYDYFNKHSVLIISNGVHSNILLTPLQPINTLLTLTGMNSKQLNITSTIAKIVERDSKKKSNYFGYSAWTHHIKVVADLSVKLAKKVKADCEIVELAAYLHDYSAIIDAKKFYPEHHLHSARLAEDILKKLNYPKNRIDLVKHCILTHRGSVVRKRETIEAECLASADAMSHITELADMMYLAYGVHKMKTVEGAKFVLGKMERSWNKLMPEAKAMIRNDYRVARKILKCSIRNKW